MFLIRSIGGIVVGAASVMLYAAVLALMTVTPWRGQTPVSRRKRRVSLLVTGRVNSINWCRSHLLPLAECDVIDELIALMDGPMIQHPKVRSIHPPAWLSRYLSPALARSIWLFKLVMAEKPDLIMAYSFFPAGVFGLLAARLGGARIVYQVTGGAVELESGGVSREHRLLCIPRWMAGLLRPLALHLCRHFDLVVGRGEMTRAFLRDRAGCDRVEIIPGSVDPQRFAAVGQERPYDVVFVGRLVAVKQPWQVLEIVRRLLPAHPQLRVAIVGDGPLRPWLCGRAEELGLLANVEFAGHRGDVERFLSSSKLFLLTSRSEGLSIALAEAMVAGAVPVVSDVGDLAELVDNGLSGWRVSSSDLDGFARQIDHLLNDKVEWQRISSAARKRALQNNSLEAVTKKWSDCLCRLA